MAEVYGVVKYIYAKKLGSVNDAPAAKTASAPSRNKV
jgi:hypothetical protein